MRHLLLVLTLLGLAVPAAAQDAPPDGFETAKWHFGPVAMNPRFSITNLGVDTNVFNTWEDPKKDFTATITPGTDVLFRAGRTMFTAKVNLGYLYFQKYSQERSFNTETGARFDVNLLHVRPYLAFSYLNTRERPGYEIDTRARRYEHTYTVGADVPLTSKVTFGLAGARRQQTYAAGETFLGSYLRDAFDRNEDTVQGSVKYRLTALTMLVAAVERTQARFTYMSVRDSNSLKIDPGVEFDAFALIQGSAHVGYRKMDLINSPLPGFSGPVASVNLGYTLAGITRFAIEVGRDVYYSYDLNNPYYVQTGAVLTITQKVRGPFDAQARGGMQRLRYVENPLQLLNSAYTDDVKIYGAGIGYHLGKTARLGFNVDSYQRSSKLYDREYRGLRIGTSVTYGQ